MEIYNYHAETGEYTISSQAGIDPLESKKQRKETYLIPAYATEIPPPTEQVGYARCFIEGEWKQVEDHREEMMYSIVDASWNNMVALGPIPADYTLLEPCEFPKWDGSKWIVDLTKKGDNVRAERDALLRATDCYMLEDFPTAKKNEWKSYRQALRDVPSQAGFPENVIWPAKPE